MEQSTGKPEKSKMCRSDRIGVWDDTTVVGCRGVPFLKIFGSRSTVWIVVGGSVELTTILPTPVVLVNGGSPTWGPLGNRQPCSLWQENLLPDAFRARLRNTSKSISAGALPRTQWQSLHRCSDPMVGGENLAAPTPHNPLRPFDPCCLSPQLIFDNYSNTGVPHLTMLGAYDRQQRAQM